MPLPSGNDSEDAGEVISNGTARMTKRKIRINLLLVSFAFLLNFSAYMCMEGLQSSLNHDIGAHALSALYAAFVMTSFCLPTLAMEFLSSRKSMIVATIPYAIYTLANCYPKPYTLLPAGVFVGAAASVLWAANRVYISGLSFAYSKENNSEEGQAMSYFYGIFWAIFSLSMVMANLISSIVLQNTLVDDYADVTPESATSRYKNVTTTHETLSASNSTSSHVILRCAMHNCDITADDTSVTDSDSVVVNSNPLIFYVLFGIFAAIQIGSALLMLCFVDDAPERVEVQQPFLRDSSEEKDKEIGVGDPERRETRSNKLSTFDRVKNQAQATGKLLAFNTSAKLLIPQTIHTGVLQGYALGQMTRYWVTCALGIEFVGYAGSVYGLGSTIGAYTAGWTTQRVARWVVVSTACLIELAWASCLLVWEPEIVSDIWLFLVAFGIVGFLNAVLITILTTIYSIFFPKEREAASAALSLWDALGATIAYAVSSNICNKTFTILMMTLITTGTLLYLITERIYAIEQKVTKQNVPEGN